MKKSAVGIAIAVVTAALVVGWPATGAHATGAHADTDLEACVGTSDFAFTPPLSQTAQSISVSGTSSYSCTINASSGTASFGTTSTLSCLNALAALQPSDRTVTWSGGTGAATSTLHFTGWQTTGTVGTAQGVVTAGRHAGATVVLVIEAIAVSGTGIPQLCPLGLGTISETITEDVLTITLT